MKITLYVLSGLFWFLSFSTVLASKSAIHEILSVLFVLAALIAMGFGFVISTLQTRLSVGNTESPN